MILEFSFNYLSSSLVYEKIILRTAKLFSLESKIVKNGDELFYMLNQMTVTSWKVLQIHYH